MVDSRSEPRKNAKIFIGVYDETAGKLIGYLLDLTTVGMKLKSKMAIRTNADFEFRIDLPIEIAKSTTILLRVNSKWCNKCDDSNYYETGFNIVNCPSEEKEKIKSLLDTDMFSVSAEKFHISLSIMEK